MPVLISHGSREVSRLNLTLTLTLTLVLTAAAQCDFTGAVAASKPLQAPAVVVVPFAGRNGFFNYADSQARRRDTIRVIRFWSVRCTSPRALRPGVSRSRLLSGAQWQTARVIGCAQRCRCAARADSPQGQGRVQGQRHK